MLPIDRAGQRFGRLLVLKQTNRTGPQRGAWVIARCDCGRHHQARLDSLVRGLTQSCGCWRREVSARKKGQPKVERRVVQAVMRLIDAASPSTVGGAQGAVTPCAPVHTQPLGGGPA